MTDTPADSQTKTDTQSADPPDVASQATSLDELPRGRELAISRPVADIIAAAHVDAQEVLKAAEQLATVLNNDRVRSAHFFVALTLTPSGMQRLSDYNLNRENIRKTTWRAIAPLDRPSVPNLRPAFSENLGDLLRQAQTRADKRGQPLTVEDILRVVTTSPLLDRYQHFWADQPAIDPMSKTLGTVQKIEEMSVSLLASQRSSYKRISYIKHTSNIIIAVLFVVVGLMFFSLLYAPL